MSLFSNKEGIESLDEVFSEKVLDGVRVLDVASGNNADFAVAAAFAGADVTTVDTMKITREDGGHELVKQVVGDFNDNGVLASLGKQEKFDFVTSSFAMPIPGDQKYLKSPNSTSFNNLLKKGGYVYSSNGWAMLYKKA